MKKRGGSYYEQSEQHYHKTCRNRSSCSALLCSLYISSDKNTSARRRCYFNPYRKCILCSGSASVAGLAFNVVADPVVGYFYKQYILGQPQKMAEVLAKMSAMATFVNAVISVILVAVIYNAVRPVLIKSHLLVVGQCKQAG